MSRFGTALRLLVVGCDCVSLAIRNRDVANENTYLRDALAAERYRAEQLQGRLHATEAERDSLRSQVAEMESLRRQVSEMAARLDAKPRKKKG